VSDAFHTRFSFWCRNVRDASCGVLVSCDSHCRSSHGVVVKKRAYITGPIQTKDPYKRPRKSQRKLFPVGSANTHEMAIEMTLQGHSIAEVVAEIGCSRSVVLRARRDLRNKR